MHRRDLIKTTALSAATAAINPRGTPSHSREEVPSVNPARPFVRWRMATSWPKSLDIVFGSADQICRRVGEMTDGRFAITPYAAGEIAPAFGVLDAIQKGESECGHTAAYYYLAQNPALAFATTVPFGLNAQQQSAWLFQGGGLDRVRALYADFGVINFPAGSTGAQMGGWFKQKIEKISDLGGLKMRIPGLGGRVMETLGVSVQVLPGEEIFAALEEGRIDAAEWVGPYEDEKLGLNRVAPIYYYPGWWEPGTTYEVQVSLKHWHKLPSEYQEILRTAVTEAHITMLAQYDSVNGRALQRLLQLGTQLNQYSTEILEAAHTAAFDLYEADSSRDSTFRSIYAEWKQFRQRIYQWNRLNELSFSGFAASYLQALAR